MKATLVVKDGGPSPRVGSPKIKKLKAILERAGYRVNEIQRTHFRGSPSADLLVSAGGDGTLLSTARYAKESQVVFGINTAPGPSVGFLCGATLESANNILQKFHEGGINPLAIRLLRIRLKTGKRVLKERALNDVLVTCAEPAEIFRYRIGVRRLGQWTFADHKSSGIWVATSAGSWAGYRAAGGTPRPLEKAQIHWRVREAYQPPHGPMAKLGAGSLNSSDKIKLVFRMRGHAYVDGSGRKYSLRPGHSLEIDMEPKPLKLLRSARP